MHVRSFAALLLALTAFAPARAWAIQLPITWGSPQTISGDSDVLTTGSLVYAFNFGHGGFGPGDVTATTVNGVTFAPFGVDSSAPQTVTVGDLTLTEDPNFLFAYDPFGYTAAPYSGLSSDYKALLDQAVYAAEPGTITIALGGLTAGQNYSVQWWTNDSSLTYGSLTTASGVTDVTLDPNTTDVLGGVGQYAIGTFTATSGTQTFTLTGSVGSNPAFDFPMISGLQLRTAGVTPVPEVDPAGMASVLTLIGGGLGLLDRRRKRA